MKRAIACVTVFCLGAPAAAADFGEARTGIVRDRDYRCFWVETLHATYPSWVVSPDPYYYFVPQYYPVYEWACLPGKRPTALRREAF